MDFTLSEAQRDVSQLARKIFKDKLTDDRRKQLDGSGESYDAALWKELATAGLLGTSLPEAFGGSEHGLLELCSLMIEAGRAAAPVPLWPALWLGALPIARFGSDAQKRQLLPALATGKAILSAALLEADSPDPAQPRTTATVSGAHWQLRGTKTCVPVANLAERVLVTARTGEDIGVFVVDPKTDGVTLAAQTATGGEAQAEMTLRDARAERLGEAAGADILAWWLPRATVGLCATELGVAEYMLRTTARYTSERHQFDRPIGTFQAVSQRAGDAYIDTQAIALSLWEAAWRLSHDLPADDAVSMAKFWAAEAGHRVAYAAQHLHGGIGFDLDYPLARYYMLSKQLELTLGSATAHLQQIGERLARRHAG